MRILVLGHRLFNPLDEVADACIHARILSSRAPVTRRHDTGHDPLSLALAHQRAARVVVAGVLAALLVTGAHHVGQDFHLAHQPSHRQVLLGAVLVRDDWYFHVARHVRNFAACGSVRETDIIQSRSIFA